MTAAEIVCALRATGADVFLSGSGAVKLRDAGAVPADLRDQARANREAIAAALVAEAAERDAELRADPRARWRSLPADHPGGLCGRFGPAAAGALLTACHRWENAWTDDEAAEALAAWNELADHHLRRIQDADTPR